MGIERHRLQREKNPGAYMEPAPDGNWVTFADHAAELARVEKENALLRAVVEAAEKLNKAIYPTIGADARSRWIIDGNSTAPGELDAALRAMEGGAG